MSYAKFSKRIDGKNMCLDFFCFYTFYRLSEVTASRHKKVYTFDSSIVGPWKRFSLSSFTIKLFCLYVFWLRENQWGAALVRLVSRWDEKNIFIHTFCETNPIQSNQLLSDFRSKDLRRILSLNESKCDKITSLENVKRRVCVRIFVPSARCRYRNEEAVS